MMEGNTMTCFHSGKMVFIRAKIHINLTEKKRYDTHSPNNNKAKNEKQQTKRETEREQATKKKQ